MTELQEELEFLQSMYGDELQISKGARSCQSHHRWLTTYFVTLWVRSGGGPCHHHGLQAADGR